MGWIKAEDYMVLRVIKKTEGKEGWVVNRTDNAGMNARIGNIYSTKKRAVNKARKVAKRNKPAKLYIEKTNGNTADIRTYT